MKRCMQILLVAMLVVGIAQGLWAADVKGLIKGSMQDLKIEKGSPNLLALTDATYVKVNGKTSEGYVDMIREVTGCSIGKGNLLFFHRPIAYRLALL